MKYLRIPIILLLTVGLLSAGNKAESPSFEKDKLLLQIMQKILERYHYLDVPFDDEFSRQVHSIYLNQLDYGKKYFLQENISELNQYKDSIDDEIKRGSLKFFRSALQTFKSRLVKSTNMYEDILAQPFDFTRQEKIELDPEKLDYAASEEAMKERWHKILKYKTLVRLNDKIDSQEARSEQKEDFEPKPFDTLEANARKSVLKSQQNLYDRIMELDHEDHLSRYLNAIGNVYDPHTGYFPPKDKENFDINMSGSFHGIGATLQKKDGYVKVVRIVTGSASWRQGDLEVGDKIMKVAQGEKEPVNIMDMPLDEAVQLIRGPKGSEVRLTVKKRDGSIKVIPIIRDVVELREIYAKAAVIHHENTQAGYIKLPKFYLDFEDDNGRSCYEDVKKYIKKLAEKDVDGAIIDLRNNGGGSLSEVIKIAGLFFDQGAVVQVRDPFGKTEVYKDEDAGTLFEKPLIIMVNSFSASASEILAAAMQDRGRGVVVGSGSTYGKGTVQRFISFDKALPEQLQMFSPLGSLKLTIQKFYRINGMATQLKGVSPDIKIPDKYTYMDIGEEERENAMQWDQIDPVEYSRWNTKRNMNALQRKSEKRTSRSEHFQLIKEEAVSIKEKSQISHYSLNLKTYKARQEELKASSDKFSELKSVDPQIDVELFAMENEEIAQDTAEIKRREKWQEKISKDLYITEAVRVLDDMQ